MKYKLTTCPFSLQIHDCDDHDEHLEHEAVAGSVAADTDPVVAAVAVVLLIEIRLDHGTLHLHLDLEVGRQAQTFHLGLEQVGRRRSRPAPG